MNSTQIIKEWRKHKKICTFKHECYDCDVIKSRAKQRVEDLKEFIQWIEDMNFTNHDTCVKIQILKSEIKLLQDEKGLLK